MENKQISSIVNELEELKCSLSKSIEATEKIDKIIVILEKQKEEYLIDKSIDRSKKIAEILTMISKIVFEYFRSP